VQPWTEAVEDAPVADPPPLQSQSQGEGEGEGGEGAEAGEPQEDGFTGGFPLVLFSHSFTVGLGYTTTFHHVILQPKHGSIDDSQYGPRPHVTNLTPGSDNPPHVILQSQNTVQLMTAGILHVTPI
jgi:hypothetical protein